MSVFTSSQLLGNMSSIISCDGDWVVEVQPFQLDDSRYETLCLGCTSYTYLYDTLLLKLGAWLPFTDFQCLVLRTLNVAPTQLHPNSWAFVWDFEILCEGLGKPPPLIVSLPPLRLLNLKPSIRKKSQMASPAPKTLDLVVVGQEVLDIPFGKPIHKRYWKGSDISSHPFEPATLNFDTDLRPVLLATSFDIKLESKVSLGQ
ncbi:hypothetical protein CR513_29739, partial [Mucuna pruriens]